MNDRIKKIEDGYYAIHCNPRKFPNGAGQTVVPNPGPVFLSFHEGGVTVDDLRAIIADIEGAAQERQESPGQEGLESSEKKRRGRPRKAEAASEPVTEPSADNVEPA